MESNICQFKEIREDGVTKWPNAGRSVSGTTLIASDVIVLHRQSLITRGDSNR